MLEIGGLRLAMTAAQAAAARARPGDGAPMLNRATLLGAGADERHGLLLSYLRTQLAGIMGLAVSEVDVALPLTRYGLDSLMTITLAVRLQRDLDIRLNTLDLMHDVVEDATLATLATMLDERLASRAVVDP
jgi:acyl carrier protein